LRVSLHVETPTGREVQQGKSAQNKMALDMLLWDVEPIRDEVD